jgi:hypothetical protein
VRPLFNFIKLPIHPALTYRQLTIPVSGDKITRDVMVPAGVVVGKSFGNGNQATLVSISSWINIVLTWGE